MKIEHIAIWVSDIETMRKFYEKYFKGISGTLYNNPKNNFSSYFLSFGQGPRLELMRRPEIAALVSEGKHLGLAHFAMSVGTKPEVDKLTEQLRSDGFRVVGESRMTGDGYYESVVLDPEGNRIEITV